MTPPATAAGKGQGKPQGVCFAYNIGACKLPCPRAFAHVCSVCGEGHAASGVPSCQNLIDKTGRPLGRKGGGKGGKQ